MFEILGSRIEICVSCLIPTLFQILDDEQMGTVNLKFPRTRLTNCIFVVCRK